MLSEKEAAMLKAFKTIVAEGGSPTFEVLRTRLRLGSKSQVFRLINQLVSFGYLRAVSVGQKRRFELTEKAQCHLVLRADGPPPKDGNMYPCQIVGETRGWAAVEYSASEGYLDMTFTADVIQPEDISSHLKLPKI